MTTHLIIITGFMGSGKTAVAYALARILKFQGLDLDAIIADGEGRTAKEIIQSDGEPAFREIETRTLSKVLKEVRKASVGSVIALGGGTWTLQKTGRLFENTSVRLYGSMSRPIFAGQNPGIGRPEAARSQRI